MDEGGKKGKEKEKKGKNLDGSGIILAYLTLLLPFTFSPFVPLPTHSLFLILILA